MHRRPEAVALPTTAVGVQGRHQQVAHRIQQLEQILADPEEERRHPSRKEYANWRGKVQARLSHLRREEEALRARLSELGAEVIPPRPPLGAPPAAQSAAQSGDRAEDEDYESFWRQ